MLTKTEMLLIRACKSRNPMKRLHSVYKHQYLQDEVVIRSLMNILGQLVDKQFPISTMSLVDELSAVNDFKYDGKTFYERVLMIYINRIRFSNVNELDGLILPIRHRKLKTW